MQETLLNLNLGTATINEPDPLLIGIDTANTSEINCSDGIQGSLSLIIDGGTITV